MLLGWTTLVYSHARYVWFYIIGMNVFAVYYLQSKSNFQVSFCVSKHQYKNFYQF